MNDSSAHHEEFASAAKQSRPNHPNNNNEAAVNESIIPTELNSDKDNALLVGKACPKSNVVVKKVSGGMSVNRYSFIIHIRCMHFYFYILAT